MEVNKLLIPTLVIPYNGKIPIEMDGHKLTDGVDTQFLTGLHSSFLHSTSIDGGCWITHSLHKEINDSSASTSKSSFPSIPNRISFHENDITTAPGLSSTEKKENL